MKRTFINLVTRVNQFLRDNKEAKTQEQRATVVNGKTYLDLMKDLNETNNYFLENNPGVTNDDNHYSKLISELTTWILKGQTDTTDKTYKSHLKDENATDFNDNIETNSKIYNGSVDNYFDLKKDYNDGILVPTKTELANNSHIKNLYDYFKELKNAKHGNRFFISKMKRQVKNDLNETILNYRGEDDFKRTDNKVTTIGKTELSLNNHEYRCFLLNRDLREIQNENTRLDKMVINDEIIGDNQILKDYSKGFNQSEVAKRNNVNQSTVSRQIRNAITTPIKE